MIILWRGGHSGQAREISHGWRGVIWLIWAGIIRLYVDDTPVCAADNVALSVCELVSEG